MKIRLILTTLLIMVSAVVFGQELQLKSFELKPVDMTAKINPVYDLNNDACALIRVAIASEDVTFQGTVVGTPEYMGGEWLVYVPKGSRRIKVACKGYLPLTIEFDQDIEEHRTYEMVIELPVASSALYAANKMRAIVSPTISVGLTPMSFGAMIGFVKKNGIFFRYKSNFDNFDTTFSVDENGVDENGVSRWFDDEQRYRRWAITGGYIRRLGQKFYILGGVGYGDRTLAWCCQDGEYASVTTSSYSGLEVELGAMVRFGSFALGGGVQSNQFKFLEGNISVGFMF